MHAGRDAVKKLARHRSEHNRRRVVHCRFEPCPGGRRDEFEKAGKHDRNGLSIPFGDEVYNALQSPLRRGILKLCNNDARFLGKYMGAFIRVLH